MNKAGIIQGHKDSPLTKDGRREADLLGKDLKALLDKGIPISRIICSDLGRCRQTAEIVNRHLDLEISYTDRLRERDFGAANAMPRQEFNKRYPLDDPDFVMPHGESFNQMKRRIIDFIRSIDDPEVLIVTHDGCVMAMMQEAGNITERSYRFIAEIRIGSGKPTLRVIHD